MKIRLITALVGMIVSLNNFAIDHSKFSISGISSGGFMADQMATIYSSEFSGVGTVAGGFYYCAEDYLPAKIKADSNTIGASNLFLFEPSNQIITDTLNPFVILTGVNPGSWFAPQKGNPIYQAVGVCMGGTKKAKLPTEYLKSNEASHLIDPLFNLRNQKAFIYHGKSDSVLNFKMQDLLKSFFLSVGVKANNIAVYTGSGSHNFPTDRQDGIPCGKEQVPYVAKCNFDLAGKLLGHLVDNNLVRADFNKDHIYLVDQNINFVNVDKSQESEWVTPVPSIAPYGYLYANDKCLNDPVSCHLHIALHGCKMTDNYSEDFQTQYQNQVSSFRIVRMRSRKNSVFPIPNFPGIPFTLPSIEDKISQYGLLKFVLDSGYINYAEQNDVMILFPQAWISENNYPYNPKGCWDWFGWTGENYATNTGSEASWMIHFIHSIAKNPKSHLMNSKPKFDLVEKNFPR